MSLPDRLGKALRDLGELFYPRGCIVTGEPIETDGGIALAQQPRG